jgi:hypothetical protein
MHGSQELPEALFMTPLRLFSLLTLAAVMITGTFAYADQVSKTSESSVGAPDHSSTSSAGAPEQKKGAEEAEEEDCD